jgi:hypothetical protein
MKYILLACLSTLSSLRLLLFSCTDKFTFNRTKKESPKNLLEVFQKKRKGNQRKKGHRPQQQTLKKTNNLQRDRGLGNLQRDRGPNLRVD